MCGIAGIVQVRGEKRIEREAVTAALKAMAHRGPDGPYVYSDGERIAIGQRRLSIIDLVSSAEQRMALRCQRSPRSLQLSFNGEIYNFRQLRQELSARHHSFVSSSDSEVILHAFEEWGENCFERFRGMFAIALWDDDNRQLTLARDRFGIKPLYYAATDDRLAFASELKALRCIAEVTADINPTAAHMFLRQGWILQPQTFYRGISALEPGSVLTVVAGRVRRQSFAQVATPFGQPENTLTLSEAVQATRTALRASVEAHLVADVEVGAFLSGGIDSSALAGLVRELSSSRLRTITAVFPGMPDDESVKARLVAERLQVDHLELPITGDDFVSHLDDIFAHMDQPTVDGVNTYFVSLAAKRAGLKVVLSGLGGDELFAGYPSFTAVPKLNHLRPLFANTLGRQVLHQLSDRQPVNSRLARLLALTEAEGSPLLSAYLNYRGLFTERQLRWLLTTETQHWLLAEPIEAEYTLPELDQIHEPLRQMSLLELTFYLRNQLLRDTDVFSMAHSIETRVPFVDHELLAVIAQLPSRYQQYRGLKKFLLIEAVRDLLPPALIGQPKQGFVVPIGRWLQAEAKSIVVDELLASPLFEREAITSLWQQFLRNRVHWSRIWSLFVASRFLRTAR